MLVFEVRISTISTMDHTRGPELRRINVVIPEVVPRVKVSCLCLLTLYFVPQRLSLSLDYSSRPATTGA